MTGAYLAAGALATVVFLVAAAYRSLHMFQLDSYRPERYLRHGLAMRSRTVELLALAAAIAVVAALLARSLGADLIAWLVLAIWVAQAVWFAWGTRKARAAAKTPLHVTARMRRLILATAGVIAATVAAIAWLFVTHGALETTVSEVAVAAYSAAALLAAAVPLLVVAAFYLMEPYEASVRRGFRRAASARLAEVAPIVIGVAGSYGKTSTKAALAAVLSTRYRVLASPESFNTLLGVTRTINEQLADDTEVFIVEMGARQPGDIREICDLVHPRIGVVSRLGPQHLEYFKSEANIIATKTELLDALPADGFGVVDADGLADYADTSRWPARVIRLSAREDAGADALLRDVTISADGTAFALLRDGATLFRGDTRLLGRHAAVNGSLAALVGLELGLTPEQIEAGLRSLQPVAHRLQVVRNDSVTVIDDAYNSNPEGFASALEVLGSFAPRRRILVTPGMVELGDQTTTAHARVGALVAQACDVVLLVGATAPPEFAAAMLEAGLPPARLERYASLSDATARLGTLIAAGDVVLLENDLPDNFS